MIDRGLVDSLYTLLVLWIGTVDKAGQWKKRRLHSSVTEVGA
jgi:hypothetical protein